MTEPDLRLDELKELAEQDDLHSFLQRALNVHPSDLADVLAALDEPTRVRVIAELPTETASSALAEMEAAEHPEELLLAVGPEYAAELVEELPELVRRRVLVPEHPQLVRDDGVLEDGDVQNTIPSLSSVSGGPPPGRTCRAIARPALHVPP